jgi:hypothetical protein
MALKIQNYELRLDQEQFPGLNSTQFGRMCDAELNKFLAQLSKLDCEFVTLRDLSPLNVACRYYKVNEFWAVRQTTHYDPNTKTILMLVDATALLNVEEEQRLPGEDKPITQVPEVTPGITAANNTLN